MVEVLLSLPTWADGTADAGHPISMMTGLCLSSPFQGERSLTPNASSTSTGLWGSGRLGISLLANIPLPLAVGRGPVILISKSELLPSDPCQRALLLWAHSSLLVQRGENPGRFPITFSMSDLYTTWSCPSAPTYRCRSLASMNRTTQPKPANVSQPSADHQECEL